MSLFSRHLFAAALCVALCPAVGRGQSAADAYYLSGDTADQGSLVAAGLWGDEEQAAPVGPTCGSCANACCGGCNSCCGNGLFGFGFLTNCGVNWPCGCKLADLGEACKLWKPCCEDSQWSGAGWLAQGFVWNPYQPNDRFNGPLTWNDRANEYQMNELFYYFGRAAKTDQCCLDWGARVDALYGTSYRWNTSAGFETHWGNGSFYGLCVPQAYAELGYNGWDVKIGRWYSPVGYYVIGTANNFFPLLPYTFQYGEPFTHTGVYATKKLNDKLTVGGAVTHGWDSSDNTGNPHAGGLISASYTIDEQRSLAYVGVMGPEPNFTGVNLSSVVSPLGTQFGYTSRYLQTLVYTRKFSDDVMGVLQSDFGTQHDAIFDPNGTLRTAKWYGLNTYLYWNMTCRCQWGLNGEWFRDQGGFRVGQVLPSFGSPNARGFARGPGYDGSFYRVTFGPRYYFTPNWYGRAAVLFDWYDGKIPADGRPFDDGLRNHQQIGVFDVVGTF